MVAIMDDSIKKLMQIIRAKADRYFVKILLNIARLRCKMKSYRNIIAHFVAEVID